MDYKNVIKYLILSDKAVDNVAQIQEHRANIKYDFKSLLLWEWCRCRYSNLNILLSCFKSDLGVDQSKNIAIMYIKQECDVAQDNNGKILEHNFKTPLRCAKRKWWLELELTNNLDFFENTGKRATSECWFVDF